MKRLYRLFVAFAIFDLLTIVLAVFLAQNVISDYSASLAASERLVNRIASYNTLHQLAGSVNAAPDNAFDHGQLETNARQMDTSVSRFAGALNDARRATMTESSAHAKAILAEIDRIDRLMRGIIADGRGVFSALRDGGRSNAEVSMARKDRGYANVRREFSVIDDLIREFHQKDAFQQQAQHLAMVRRYGFVVAALIALSVIATALYARRMLREMLGTDQREQYLNELQRREEELRRANVAFANAMEGIAFLDADRRYTFVNRAYAETLGYEPEQLNGTLCVMSIHPDDVETMMAGYREMREQGKAERDIRAVRSDGTIIDIHVMIVASRDEHDLYLGCYRFIKDVTEQKRAESALRRSEERFQLAARATNDVVFERDLKTGACWCNEAMSQFSIGVSGDIDAAVWSDAVHPDDGDRVLTGLQTSVAAGEQFWSAEYRFRKSNGAYADVLTQAYIVHSATREPLRMIGVTMDITERKRAERAYNTQILNSAADGIFGLDAVGTTTFVNESAARLLGWSVGELVGKGMHATTHHHRADGSMYPSEDCPAYATLRTGETGGSDQDVFWRKDGSTMAVEYATTAIRDGQGKVVGAVVTFRDVSERRAIERMKDEFVSVVSHELRTPLTSIRGALGLLAGGRVGEIPEKGKRMLDIAVSNTDRLVRLINDILDIERMESGQITLTRQRCDSYELMAQAIELIRPMAEKAEVTLQCTPCHVPLWADPDRLLQTFSNLLSNAVKFSLAGGVVSLSAMVADANVVFEVADEGRGIPADKLDLIFERFQQVDASDSRQKGGSGLGLAICRSIVRQHGGEIHAESTLGKESRFRFTIPGPAPVVTTPTTGRTVVVCDDEPSNREIMCTPLEQQGQQILLIEDDPDLARVVTEGFAQHSVQTFHAASGAAAIEPAQRVNPDLIILDLVLPDIVTTKGALSDAA